MIALPLSEVGRGQWRPKDPRNRLSTMPEKVKKAII